MREGLPVLYVTEDTTRADPETLRRLYSTAIRAGAARVCIADTVGHATPAGAAAVVRFVAQVVEECGGGVGIDWHGHRDRDLAVINSLAALEAGATRLHGAGIGIGERVGNTPMDMLLVNLVLMGYIERDLSALVEYCGAVSQATGVPIPPNYPVVGRDAFRTATGVHAAAVIKAFRKKDQALVDAVYSGVPASLVGREQEIEVGPMSGKSNVVFWLEKRGLPVTDEIVERIFAKAKGSSSVLEEAEIRELDRISSACGRSELKSGFPEHAEIRELAIADFSRSRPTPRSALAQRFATRSGRRRCRSNAASLHRRLGFDQSLLDIRQRRQQHIAHDLQRCRRHLVERIAGRVPRGVVEVDDVDGGHARLEEPQVVVFDRRFAIEELRPLQPLRRGPDDVGQPGRRARPPARSADPGRRSCRRGRAR